MAPKNNLSKSRAIKTHREKCGFCLIPAKKTTDYFQQLHGDLPHILNIPGVPDSWMVLQDAVPIAEYGGHILLMPNQHHISLATADDQEGLSTSINAIVIAIQNHFPRNPIFVFEHGPGFIQGEQIACGGCHLDHAHGHFLLLPEGTKFDSIKDCLEESLVSAEWQNPHENAIQSTSIFTNLHEATGINPYLQIGIIDQDITQSFTYIQKKLREQLASQLLRRITSEVVFNRPGAGDWHWRDIVSGFVSSQRLKQIQKDVLKFRELTGF